MFKSHKLIMFTMARDYKDARNQFKSLLLENIKEEHNPIFDELIEITRLTHDGSVDDMSSYVEFTDKWLKELGVTTYIIKY